MLLSFIKIVDVAIILLVLAYGIAGLKRGAIKQSVMTVGIILVFMLAFYFKNPLAKFLSSILPFFDFSGSIKGLTSLNILVYQMISFILVFVVLVIVLNVLIKISDIFEKVLKATIILSIPSKIGGFIIGLIEGYVVVFIVLFFLSQPAVNLKILNESKLMPKVLNSSPGLTNIVRDTNESISEIYEVTNDYKGGKSSDEYNREIVDVMLKNKIVTVDYMDTIIKKKKLSITGLNEVIDKYR